MKEWKNHQRNEEKEVEILDFNQGKTGRKTKKQQKQMKKAKRSRNKEFAVVTYVFLALFIGMTGYFIYFIQVESDDFINNPYNARLDSLEKHIVRGDILAQDGTVLAETIVDEAGGETRYYPYQNMFAHAIGYSVNGMAGVELDANFSLLQSNAFLLQRLANEVIDKKNPGDSVVTTLDVSLQSACYEAMGQYQGAAICLEPSTGKVLAMVSKPDFDPNTISENWEYYIHKETDSAVLLNRATQGLYPPGSTFKIMTLLSYLQQNKTQDYSFTCNGSYTYQGSSLSCYNKKSHGEENLIQAFGNSCNSAFADIGLSLQLEDYNKLCEDMLFNKNLPSAFSTTAKSRMHLEEDASPALIMQTAIGQGETMVSPLHMAMIASAVANKGLLMEPYIIDHTQNKEGAVVKRYSPKKYGQLFSAEEAAVLEEYMEYVVRQGTAMPLQTESYQAYGKTGTAEFSSNKQEDHSWFVGYGKDDTGKEIAIAVVMERVSSGSSHALPATKKIFDAYFSSTM